MDTFVYEGARSGDLGFLEKSRDCKHLLLQKTPRNNNILHLAAEFGQIDFFKVVLIHIQSPQFWATNNKGDTPMHVFARAGCDEIVGLLITQARKLGADEEGALADGEAYNELLRTKNSIGDMALHVAIRQGDLEVVILLVEADSGLCCLTNIANELPLFLAISKGFRSIAFYMLDNSQMSPSFQGINGVTALHAVVTGINYEGIVQMMVSKNPEIIKEVNANGWTPLHYAALTGNVGAIRLLMQQDVLFLTSWTNLECQLFMLRHTQAARK